MEVIDMFNILNKVIEIEDDYGNTIMVFIVDDKGNITKMQDCSVADEDSDYIFGTDKNLIRIQSESIRVCNTSIMYTRAYIHADRILEQFRDFLGEEVKGLDLMVADEETIMETRDNGKVWTIKYDDNDNIIEVYEV